MLRERISLRVGDCNTITFGVPSPVVLTGDACFIVLSRLVGAILFFSMVAFGQFKNVQGNLGIEYERQIQTFTSSNDNLSRFHQVFNIFSNGYVFHPNLAEFSLNTRFRNINSNTSTNLGNLTQHDTYFNFYDANVEILKLTNYPVTLYAKQDVNTNELSNELIARSFTKTLSTNFGGRFSSQFGTQYPRLILSYDNFSSKGLNTAVSNDMRSQNYHASLDGAIGKNTTWDLELRQNDRRYTINNLFYSSREAQMHTSSFFSSRDQLSTNFSFTQENDNTSTYLSSMWHKQIDDLTANQLSLELRRFSYLDMRTYAYQISDQYNMPLTGEWNGLALLRHVEAAGVDSRNSTLTFAAMNDHSFNVGESNFLSQITYQRNVYASILHSVEHLTSGAFRCTTLPFGIVQIGEQFKIRKMIGTVNRSNINNSTSLSIESDILQSCTVRSNSTISYSKEFGNRNSVLKNYSMFVDIQYTLRSFLEMLLNINYVLTTVSTPNYSNTTDRYSGMLTLPGVLPNFNIQTRISILRDRVEMAENKNYEVNATYNLRAVAFTLRYAGYNYRHFTRNDFYFTVTRPFSFEFD